MHQHHQEILEILSKASGKTTSRFNVSSYLGSPSTYIHISTAKKRSLVKEWAKNHKDISFKEFVNLLDSLVRGASFQEKSTAAELLIFFSEYRKTLDPLLLDSWLSYLAGWAEVDTLCQGTFEPEELLTKWPEWKKLLQKLVKDDNVNKRRASLVLLTKAVRKNPDERLKKIAFSHIENLEHERNILITKAISWLLRSLITYHPSEVKTYLETHKNSLPPIAYRETKTKLLTGKKYVKKLQPR